MSEEDVIIEETFEPGEHGCIETLSKHFDGPFELPIIFNRETGELSVNYWMLKLYKLTKGGNISKVGGGYIPISFCPMCGDRLIPEEKEDG